jgi:O-succinylbenzoate synthase
MLRLERIQLREIHLPLREPFRISSGVLTARRITLLELVDADGVVAWSECVAEELPNYSPDTAETSWLALREWLAPRVLGGTRERIEVGISLGIQKTPEALVERAGKALADGYRKIKVKIKPGADVEYIRAVRAALGPDAPLMVDANNAYSLADADHLAELDAFDLVMIEQPLEHEDLVRHAELQRRLKTPLCLDESITSLNRALDMITLGSGRIINIKPGRVGGFLVSRQIHDVCAAHGIPVWCGGMLESGVGRAHNVALASLPNFRIPGDLSPSARYWERDVVIPEWTMDAGGLVTVPTTPGLGVTVDRDRVEDLTVRAETLTAR